MFWPADLFPQFCQLHYFWISGAAVVLFLGPLFRSPTPSPMFDRLQTQLGALRPREGTSPHMPLTFNCLALMEWMDG